MMILKHGRILRKIENRKEKKYDLYNIKKKKRRSQ